MSKVERFANEAVFILQLNSREAAKYTRRNSGCTDIAAETAIKQVLTWYCTKS